MMTMVVGRGGFSGRGGFYVYRKKEKEKEKNPYELRFKRSIL